jgi:uncharacterized protein (DUF736 family)
MKTGNYDDTDRGVLFREFDKKSEKAPDLRGKLNVAGHDYELAAWERTSAKGVKYLSLKISEPRQRGESTRDPSKADEDSRGRW